MWNEAGERHGVKWHVRALQGIKTLTNERAVHIAGADPELHRWDLHLAMARGEFPRWQVMVQLMPDGDGCMRLDSKGGGDFNCEPNSAGGPVEDARLREPPLRLRGDAGRYAPGDEAGDSDHFSQAGELYRLMSAEQRAQLVDKLVAPLKAVPRAIQLRQMSHFFRADADCGKRVAAGLGIAPPRSVATPINDTGSS